MGLSGLDKYRYGRPARDRHLSQYTNRARYSLTFVDVTNTVSATPNQPLRTHNSTYSSELLNGARSPEEKEQGEGLFCHKHNISNIYGIFFWFVFDMGIMPHILARTRPEFSGLFVMFGCVYITQKDSLRFYNISFIDLAYATRVF